MSACCECCVLSGRGLCVGLVTCPEETCRVWSVWVWLWSLSKVEAVAPFKTKRPGAVCDVSLHLGGGGGVWQQLLRSYCVMGGLSPGAKRPWRVAHRWSISDAEVKNEWSYTYHPQCAVLARYLVKHRGNFAFTLPASVCTPFSFCFRLLSFYILRICICLFVLFLFIFLPFQTPVFFCVLFTYSFTFIAYSSSSSLGPGAYAPDKPQPVGLLCYPFTALVF
jgi:hypothetical protein